jgi:hypothetical protein
MLPYKTDSTAALEVLEWDQVNENLHIFFWYIALREL